jgi:hypothetical protein
MPDVNLVPVGVVHVGRAHPVILLFERRVEPRAFRFDRRDVFIDPAREAKVERSGDRGLPSSKMYVRAAER